MTGFGIRYSLLPNISQSPLLHESRIPNLESRFGESK